MKQNNPQLTTVPTKSKTQGHFAGTFPMFVTIQIQLGNTFGRNGTNANLENMIGKIKVNFGKIIGSFG